MISIETFFCVGSEGGRFISFFFSSLQFAGALDEHLLWVAKPHSNKKLIF